MQVLHLHPDLCDQAITAAAARAVGVELLSIYGRRRGL